MLINFRKVKCYIPKKLTEHSLFRSATFDFATKSELNEIAKKHNIRTYIDLRSKAEIKNSALQSVKNISIVSVPIQNTDHYLRSLKNPSSQDYFEFYKYIVDNNQATLITLVEKISQFLKQHSIVIGCFAGKDRTGIAIILFLMQLGIDTNQIIADYCATTAELQRKLDYFEQSWIRKGLNKSQYAQRLIAHKETAAQFINYVKNHTNILATQKNIEV